MKEELEILEQLADFIEGKELDSAQKILKCLDLDVRIIMIDDKPLLVTSDHIPNRFNLEVKGGIIVHSFLG